MFGDKIVTQDNLDGCAHCWVLCQKLSNQIWGILTEITWCLKFAWLDPNESILDSGALERRFSSHHGKHDTT